MRPAAILVPLVCLGCWVVALPAGEAVSGAADHEFFEKRVRPVLATQCYECHSSKAEKLQASLVLDDRRAMLTGGDSGPALVPGKPDESLLVEAVTYDNVGLQMPPHGKLPPEQIADLSRWVEMGAPWPAEAAPESRPAEKYAFDLAARKRAHWAWQPLKAGPVPQVRDKSWPRSPIDRHILAKLEERSMHPAADAAGRTLLRRVYFDLIGLPPSPAEVDAFLADRSPQALERVVDRLLASPQFGVKWARHWLDLMRYAETRGHEFDYAIPNAFEYRDYVVRALNADVPYNQLVTEHLAGDLLASPRLHPTEKFNESILGTGFWHLGEATHSPVDLLKDEADHVDNAIDVFGRAFLGLTVACARCHDHKFDAISTKDYYALSGFLRSSRFRLAPFDTELANRRVAEKLTALSARHEPALRQALAAAIRPAVDRVAAYLLAAGSQRLGSSHSDDRLDPKLLERWRAHLTAAIDDRHDPLHVWATLPVVESPSSAKWTASVARARDAALGRQQQGAESLAGATVVVDYANAGPEDWITDGVAFGLGPVRPGELRWAGDAEHPRLSVARRAAAEQEPMWDVLKPAAGVVAEPGRIKHLQAGRTLHTRSFPLVSGRLFYLIRGGCQVYAEVDAHRVNNGPLHGRMLQTFKPAGDHFHWVEHNLADYQAHRVHLEFTPDVGSDFAIAMVVQASQPPAEPDERPNRLLLEALSEGQASPAALAAAYQNALRAAVDDWSAADPNACDADAARLAGWLVDHRDLFSDEHDPARATVDALTQRWAAERTDVARSIKPQMRLAPGMLDGSGDDQRVLIRGNPHTQGDLVARRFLEAIAGENQPAIAHGSGRLELARRLTDPANPFISRVIVNRLWQHLFGRGIVASVDNFGVLGEAPSHPELLDELALRFIEDGWSIKAAIRRLVLSRTYQMSSESRNVEAELLDPKNWLWHRMPVRRLEAEQIRDALLAVSGRLDNRLGGPSVPVHLTAFMDGRGKPGQSGPLDGAGRRSLYVEVRRNFLSPMLLSFDMPIPFNPVGQRSQSNVPAQALILMNDPFVHEQATLWARKTLERHDRTPDERVADLYATAFARQPTDTERQMAIDFLEQQGRAYNLSPAETMTDQRVWADLAHVLCNAKEFIYLE
jgi:uncharacterized protein DUF1553/uncharacterized protein DUF1549/cytochrome c